MVAKILGAQRDFSFGEIDVALKRADEHPARKAGLRQMANARILNSGAIQDRPGRRALYPVTNSGLRTERLIMSSGNVFDIQFASGRVKIIDSTGTTVGNFTLQGNGAALPWASTADIQSIVFAQFNLTITICFGHAMRPQVISWDGVSTWGIADYTEQVNSGQKRTPFYRLGPPGAVMAPSGLSGNITVTIDQPWFVAGHVGTRMRFCGRQILITAVTTSQLASATVEEILPGSQSINLGATIDPSKLFSIGDVVEGSVSGAKGYVSVVNVGVGTSIGVQLLNITAATATTVKDANSKLTQNQQTLGFVVTDIIVGPGGSGAAAAVSVVGNPDPTSVWDEQIMDGFHGYPASCFLDQFRVGFCNFKSIPGGICWSAINSPSDLYANDASSPDNAIFEIVPAKAQVYYVVPGPESSEFVFCDRRIYYIPISSTNPLKPGSIAFQLLSGDGAAQVQPRVSQEAILYANAGGNSVMAIIATGAFLRPFNTKNLAEFHAHLFNNIQCIAAPSADGTFNERYAYVLNGDGTIAVGKYDAQSLAGNQPEIGWGPWSGAATVSWIGAYAADVLFTSSYFGAGLVEILDDSQFLDSALFVNAAPTAFTPPGGKGPLWFIPSQSVTLIDQVTRVMGTYAVDANGFIVPQFNGGEDLTLASLVAGQPWTMTVEPFCPDASPGTDVGQRMFRRRVARFAAYVIHSTGFKMSRLFSGPITPTSPALGTEMNFTRFTAWNMGDDTTKPPPQRETAERTRPIGRSFDPRVAVIKDTPGPLTILELGLEATV